MEDIDLKLFQVQLPSGWKTQVMVTCTPPPEAKPRRSAVFLRKSMEGAESLQAFANTQRDALAGQLPQFSLLYDAATDLGGKTLPLLVFGWQADEGRLTQVQAYYPGPGDTAWIATLTASAEEYDALLPEFQVLLGAFTPTDAAGA